MLQVETQILLIVASCDQILICCVLPDTSIPPNKLGKDELNNTPPPSGGPKIIQEITHNKLGVTFTFLTVVLLPGIMFLIDKNWIFLRIKRGIEKF